MGALRQKCVANFYNFTATPSYSIHQYYNDFTKDPGMFTVCCVTLLLDSWVKDICVKAIKLSLIFEYASDLEKNRFQSFYIIFIKFYMSLLFLPPWDMARYVMI